MQLKGLIIKDGNEAGNPPPLDRDPTQYEKKSLPPIGMGDRVGHGIPAGNGNRDEDDFVLDPCLIFPLIFYFFMSTITKKEDKGGKIYT